MLHPFSVMPTDLRRQGGREKVIFPRLCSFTLSCDVRINEALPLRQEPKKKINFAKQNLSAVAGLFSPIKNCAVSFISVNIYKMLYVYICNTFKI